MQKRGRDGETYPPSLSVDKNCLDGTYVCTISWDIGGFIEQEFWAWQSLLLTRVKKKRISSIPVAIFWLIWESGIREIS